MERITIQTILEIEDLLEVSAKKGRFEPELFLPTLKDKGFYTCAYYDAVPNIASDDYQLYLAAICCENDQKKYIGSSVQFRETSLSRGHLKKRPHIQEAEDCYQTDKLKKHTDCLCITDKLRIHVPIFVDELLIGALSCSWGGSVSLDEEQVDMFWMLGKMFSTYWQMANSNLAHSLFDEIKDTLTSKRFEQNSVYDILEMATQLVGQAFDTEVVALFEYNWYSDKLIKIHEWNTFANHRDNIEEEYQSGQFLTGKAWKYKKHRNIVDFDEFMKEYDKDIELKSLEYHQNLLTEIKTILYYPFGTKTRYLFRLVNRSNNEVSFPFLSSHKIVLTSVLDKLGTLIDDVVDAQRMNHLQSVSKSAISNISSNEKTLDSIKNALSLEGVRHLGMMAYTGNNIHFTHKYFSENNYLSQIQTHCSWEDDDFYKKCIDVEGISVLKLSDFREALKVNNLLKALVKDSITCVVIVPFSSLVIHGFFIVVPPQNLNYTYKLSLARLPEFHKRSLATYAGIVAGGIESADSYLTSENARRLVGQIGHEVASPVAELGQTAILSAEYAIEVLNLIAANTSTNVDLKEHIDELNTFANDADTQMQQMQRLMDVAVDMAQETKGQVSATYKGFNLYKTLLSAVKEAKRDLYIDKNGKIRSIEFIFNKASKSMSLYVGDQYLIKKAFVNIFRNAIKYSMPASSNRYEPIKIQVLGNPQEKMFNLQVINWGNPLKNDKMDIIFNAFERGDPYDKFKARRGMGLGLYVARKFLDVHGGNVFCKESCPTLDDPSRKYIEGWRTTFELRLPLGLREGVSNEA